METNLLIEASAGTGKTHTLAQRLIDLLRSGVKSPEMIALTFSRAAAGEIFERFVTLLASYAKKDAKDLQLLREVIETQHLSQIGTLDGFLLRIVQSFPLELGLMGALQMMSDYEGKVARSQVSFSILRKTDPALRNTFVQSFAHAMNGTNVRSFIGRYRDFITNWHEHYLSLRNRKAWGVAETISQMVVDLAQSNSVDLNQVADAIEGLVDSPKWQDVPNWVRSFNGKLGGEKGFIKKILEFETPFEGSEIEISFNRKKYVLAGDKLQALRNALRAVYGVVLSRTLETMRGIYALIDTYEKSYNERVRRKGKLVFSDVPRLIQELNEETRLALEYRMDMKIRAWALDEFQDTSREQWAALSNLLDEAKQSGGEKSVLIVGDCKQAIYGWRNGDVGIFMRERASDMYSLKELSKSWRFGDSITKAVNKVFQGGRISEEFPSWQSPTHKTEYPERKGFVQCVPAKSWHKEDYVEPILTALQAVEPVKRGISTAILVRSNTLGQFIADSLWEKGMTDVIWEGDRAIVDTPALVPFLDAITLADHPGDEMAYNHFATTFLAQKMYPQGVPSASEISLEISTLLTRMGLVGTLHYLRRLLPVDSDETWDQFSESCFIEMVRAANEFELGNNARLKFSDFTQFLAAKTKRHIAEPGKIKIMTIHRSKGLGFDYVILPLYEKDGINSDKSELLKTENWVLPSLNKSVAKSIDGIKQAYDKSLERAEQESLCTYYVAMTRSKYALTIITRPESNLSESIYFSDLVRGAITENIGNPQWYEEFSQNNKKEIKKTDTSDFQLPYYKRAQRKFTQRRMPSKLFHTGMKASELFMSTTARKEALAKGIEQHSIWEKVEWIDATKAHTPLECALVKPQGFVELWRERAYEVYWNGEWESGQFDRVVFMRDEAGNLCATIYDYKSNRKRADEDNQAFHERLKSIYARQMVTYRYALSKLANIPLKRIRTALLVLETQEVVGSGE